MLGNARQTEIGGRRSKCEHDVIVRLNDAPLRKYVMVAYRPALGVYFVNLGENELCLRELRADGRYHVAHFEFARGDLRKHRRKKAVILPVEQNDLRFPA